MAFLDLVDRSGRIQLQARVDELGEAGFERLLSLDIGDLVGVEGVAFRSRRGELTLRITDFTLLAKSLRPPPEKHHGLQDVETRFRHRELDLMASEDARELFTLRARVISAVRRFLDREGFIASYRRLAADAGIHVVFSTQDESDGRLAEHLYTLDDGRATKRF